MKIKLLGISSSPRHGNTEILVREALASGAKIVGAMGSEYSVETELISFKGKKIQGCLDCKACVRNQSMCILKDDWEEMMSLLTSPAPHGVIIGSPVYFFSVNSALRAFMERATCLMKGFWYPNYPIKAPDWSRTAAGAVSVGFHRHGGQEHAITNILQWFLVNGFVTVGSCSTEHGPVGYIGGAGWEGLDETDRGAHAMEKDEFGLLGARIVGENVGRTAVLLAAGSQAMNRNG